MMAAIATSVAAADAFMLIAYGCARQGSAYATRRRRSNTTYIDLLEVDQ